MRSFVFRKSRIVFFKLQHIGLGALGWGGRTLWWLCGWLKMVFYFGVGGGLYITSSRRVMEASAFKLPQKAPL